MGRSGRVRGSIRIGLEGIIELAEGYESNPDQQGVGGLQIGIRISGDDTFLMPVWGFFSVVPGVIT